MLAPVSRRVPLQRPWIAALSVVVERALVQAGDRPYGERPWVALARSRGVHALIDLSERQWHEAQGLRAAADDQAYVVAVTDALIGMLQAILWTVTLRSCGEVPRGLSGLGPEAWLVGAWPVEQPKTTPKTLEWPSPFGMTEQQLVASMQNAVLHMAYYLTKRLDKMGIQPRPLEVVA